MSECRWCDIGQHPFSGTDPGKTVVKLEKQVRNQWGGYQPSDVVQEACAACSADSGLKQLQLDPALSEDEVLAHARRVRDNPASFRPGPKALSVGPTDVERAKAQNRDPDYVEALQYMVDNPGWKPPWKIEVEDVRG